MLKRLEKRLPLLVLLSDSTAAPKSFAKPSPVTTKVLTRGGVGDGWGVVILVGVKVGEDVVAVVVVVVVVVTTLL